MGTVPYQTAISLYSIVSDLISAKELRLGGDPMDGTDGTLILATAAEINALHDGLQRSALLQEDAASYPIPMLSWRIWDAIDTGLPGTSATDNLGLIGGTFGSSAPTLQTYDVKSAGAVTLYARTEIILPQEYVAGQTVTLRFRAAMLTTVADTSATLDVECYEADDGEGGIGADICATAAQDINSLSWANFDFTITPTALVPGSILDVRIAIAVNDGAGAAVVKACIGKAELLLDIKG